MDLMQKIHFINQKIMSLFNFFRKKKDTGKIEPVVNDNTNEMTFINDMLMDKWRSVVDRAFKDYSSLSDVEKLWYNIRILIDGTNNGGLISYYYNNGGEYVYEAIKYLDILEMYQIQDIIKYYNQIIFGEIEVPKDLEERNEYISNLTEEKSARLDELEDEIWENKLTDKLEDRLTEYLNSKTI